MFANLLSKSTRADFAEELERQQNARQQVQQQKAQQEVIEFKRRRQIESQIHNQAAQ